MLSYVSVLCYLITIAAYVKLFLDYTKRGKKLTDALLRGNPETLREALELRALVTDQRRQLDELTREETGLLTKIREVTKDRDALQTKIDEVIRVGALNSFELAHFDRADHFDGNGPIADTRGHDGPEFETVRRLIAVTKEALDNKTEEMGFRADFREVTKDRDVMATTIRDMGKALREATKELEAIRNPKSFGRDGTPVTSPRPVFVRAEKRRGLVTVIPRAKKGGRS